MTNQKLRLVLPKGSLNDGERGDTEALFKTAGYDISGYRKKNEERAPIIRNDPEIAVRVDRPQDISDRIISIDRERVSDAGILGEDWNYERGGKLVKVCDLNYGWVKIVAAVKQTNEASNLDELLMQFAAAGKTLKVATEYPVISRDAIARTDAYREMYGNRKPSIFFLDDYIGENKLVKIKGTAGSTEEKADNNSADAIIEVTQTGSSIRKAELKIIGTVMESVAGLYTSEAVLEDAWKREKIEDLATMLMGAVAARQQQYVVAAMNIPTEKLEGFAGFLKDQGYCKKSPTVSVYGDNAVVEVVVPMARYPSAVKQMLAMGADDIINRNTGQIVSRMEFPSLYR